MDELIVTIIKMLWIPHQQTAMSNLPLPTMCHYIVIPEIKFFNSRKSAIFRARDDLIFEKLAFNFEKNLIF